VRGAAPAAAKRLEWLARIERWLDVPMMVLGVVWLALLIWELVAGLSPPLEAFGMAIWGLFILDFVVEFVLAPRKVDYLQRNWLTALSLFVPALRFFRILRVLRVTRGLRLVKVVGSLGRGMRVLGASLGRRGFGYVVALTLLVTFGGAAGMYAFEHDSPGGLRSYGDALWWTAMVMTTMGSQYWPQTLEGRVLCVLLALYAFTIFGYVTAMLATYFVERDAMGERAGLAGATAIQALKAEITALRMEIVALRDSKSR
jgi:voltage-gated potassium channel